MSIATLHRISARIARSPTLLRHRPFSSPSAPTPSAKVSDRIVHLSAIDAEGKKHQVVGLTGQTLLKALCNAGLIDLESHRLEQIDACSAECEVHVAQEWLERLSSPSYDESYVLKRNSRNREVNKHARLGCQVVLEGDLEGMVVAVPKAKPWDTN
ncbi:hypothetical protein QJS10_CPA16g00131 [Acorus calamus]|uniref:Ferredoxin n=1 Tax=Acorus calamus TaxID=4465 RepID=A0AAV9D1C8_ACOCL|nr:hypothetical protein QJS10_CPA16g00131 [Acorus calamus]